jgi:hypothetical protein
VTRRSRIRPFGLATLALVAGCGRAEARRDVDRAADRAVADSIARVRRDAINRAQPGYIVDSALPIEEALRRFRADLGDAPSALRGGAPTRDALVASFVGALESNDTTMLVRLALTRAEFAWLVYPGSPYTAPPYRQAPDLVWMRIVAGSGRGLARLLDRYGGRPLGTHGCRCDSEPERHGEYRVWRQCAMLVDDANGRTRRVRLFGDIIERDGHFKLVSFANDL